MRRLLRSDENGVATVVGAVLIAAVVFAGVAAYRVNHVPVHVAQAEASAMAGTVDALLRLSQEIDHGGTTSGGGTPLRLSRERATILEPPSIPHSVAFEPARANASQGIALQAPSILIVERDGLPVLSTSENWTPIDATTLSGMGAIHSFRLRIDSITRHNDNDNVTVAITGNGSLIARVVVNVTYDSEPGSYDIRLRVTDANGLVAFDQGTAYHITRTIAPYWLNLLDPEYRVGALLASAPRPIGVTLTTADNPSKTGQGGSLSAHFAVSSTPADGSTNYLNMGALASDPRASAGGGRLVYRADLMGHVPQTFTMEHGALLVSQPDGDAFRSPPPLRAVSEGGRTVVHLAAPTLTGVPAHVAGGVASVRVQMGTEQSFVGLVTNVTLDVATQHPSAWTDHLRDTLVREAGLTEGNHFNITQTATGVRLSLDGKGDASSRDIVLRVRTTTVQLDLQA